jgi:hypothetical protein
MVPTGHLGVALSEPQPARGRRHRWGRRRSSSTARLFEPNLGVRLRARARRLGLDRALATGADPSASPLLAARAVQLVDPGTRQQIAASLEQLVSTMHRQRRRVQTLPLPGAVRANQDALIELARMLRQREVSYAQGVAMVELILRDGTGPAYTDPSGEGLAHQLARAAAGLIGYTPRTAGC